MVSWRPLGTSWGHQEASWALGAKKPSIRLPKPPQGPQEASQEAAKRPSQDGCKRGENAAKRGIRQHMTKPSKLRTFLMNMADFDAWRGFKVNANKLQEGLGSIPCSM